MSEYNEPPDLTGKKIDFSQAHFLDHWPWQCPRAEHAYGGWRTHLRYAWQFKWSERVRAATMCRIGLHAEVQWWGWYDEDGNRPKRREDRAYQMTGTVCSDCGKPMSTPQRA